MFSVRACMCACMCAFVTFLNQALYLIQIYSPNLQRMFMALKKIMVLIQKNNLAAITDCSKIIDMF